MRRFAYTLHGGESIRFFDFGNIRHEWFIINVEGFTKQIRRKNKEIEIEKRLRFELRTPFFDTPTSGISFSFSMSIDDLKNIIDNFDQIFNQDPSQK